MNEFGVKRFHNAVTRRPRYELVYDVSRDLSDTFRAVFSPGENALTKNDPQAGVSCAD